MKTVSYKTWGIISGVIWLLATLVTIIRTVVSFHNNWGTSYYSPSFFSVYWVSVIIWVLDVLFAISLLTDILPMAKVSRIIAAVEGLVSGIGSLAAPYINTPLYLFSSFLGLAASILIVVALFSLGKNGQLFCFIALGCRFLSIILSGLSFGTSFGILLGINLITFVLLAAELITLSFYVAGKPKQLAAASASAEVQASAAADSRSSIEKLAALKSLLDKGILTKEEFEEKKTELLGR